MSYAKYQEDNIRIWLENNMERKPYTPANVTDWGVVEARIRQKSKASRINARTDYWQAMLYASSTRTVIARR